MPTYQHSQETDLPYRRIENYFLMTINIKNNKKREALSQKY